MENAKPTEKTMWFKKLTFQHWGTIVGSLILFFSWIVEKEYKSNWEEKRDELRRSQLVIDIEEVNRSIYDLEFLHELSKQPIDSFSLANAALGQTRTKLNLYTWGVARVSENSEESSKMMAAKRVIIEISEKSLIAGNYQKIFEAHNFVSDVFAKNYMKNDNSYSDKVDEVNAERDKWSRIFFWLYILGSALLGASYIYGKVTEKTI